MSISNQGMKLVVFETLNALLSGDSSLRQNAEQQMKLLEVTDDYGIHLTDITLDKTIAWPIRQLSLVLLKQFVNTHWSKSTDKFQEPEVDYDSKVRIRGRLLCELDTDCDLSETGPEKKLKSSVAYVISTIAHFDWPEEWPELFDILVRNLASSNLGAIYGSMKVFVEISHEVVDTQIPTVAPIILPKMVEIFSNSSHFSLRTRGRAVQVFSYLAETIAAMSEYDKVSAKMYLDPVLPHFLDILIKYLQMPDSGGDIVDVGLKKEIYACLSILIKHYRKRMKKWMPQILGPVWYSLTTSAIAHVKTVVNSDSDDSDYNNPVDSDGEVLSLENVIYSLFDFVSLIVENPSTRKMVKSNMADLIYYLLIYMQITDEQVQVWSSNPDQFVEDEDDDSYAYSVRLSAQEIIMTLATEFEEAETKQARDEFHAALIAAISKHFNESNQAKQSNANWWKIQESCLLALGSLANSLLHIVSGNTSISADLKCILDNIYLVTADSSPFFAGRCLWTAARFAAALSPPILDRFLQTAVTSFQSTSSVYKICSVRATYAFCEHLKETNQTDLMKPYLQPITDGLISLCPEFSSEVLALALETISNIITVDDDFTLSVEGKVSALAIACFIRHSSDPVLISICQDTFAALSANVKTAPIIQQRLQPTLMSILRPNQTNQAAHTLQPVAIDILTTMIRKSPLPLSDTLMRLFPVVSNCILKTVDDNSTMQNGGECLRAYVSRATEQIVAFKDPETNTDGLTIVMQVCLHLLDPRVNESCAAFVGRLISIVIMKASSYLGPDNIHLLLRSVLSKLQTAEALSVIQSLIMVFAHLFNHELTTVLDFLSSIPGPSGARSALEFVLSQWLSRQHLFFGTYENKVCILALCKLLEHSVMNFSGDSGLNLNLIQVPGEPVISDGAGIVTRSKSKGSANQWTSIPCSIKILKLLVQEIRNIEEGNERYGDSDDDDDEEEDYETSETSSPHNKSIQELIYDAADDYEDDDEEEDEDIAVDPLNQVNLREHLTLFIRSFKTSPLFVEFYHQLNDGEKASVDKL
ncbi:Importin-9 [Halotydeus destructor]|nr:Importin-9 [Halotydeus destructor]